VTFPTPNRYSELVRSIISGSFYNSSGVVVPYSNTATVFLLETELASTNFGYYVNEVFKGSILSDASGNVEFSVLLPMGESELTFVSSVSGQKIVVYVTARDYAIWLASYAENLEVVDANIIQARNNLAIKTADIDTLENFYGEAIEVYQDLDQDVEAYRNQVQELRAAFRTNGGTFKGLDASVVAITQIPPFGYSRRKWGPNWVLDQSMVVNHRFLDRGHTFASGTTSNITGVTPLRVEPDVVGGTTHHALDYYASTNTLKWTPSGASNTHLIEAVDGELFLPGPYSTERATLLGGLLYTGTFAINASTNDKLYIDVDGLGLLTVTLTAGGTQTAANIEADINAASFADARYPAVISYVYNGRVSIRSQEDGGSVKLLYGAAIASLDVFGFKSGCISIPTAEDSVTPGVTLSKVKGFTIDFYDSAIPDYIDSELVHEYNASWTEPHRFSWKAGGQALGGTQSVSSSGTYTVTDGSLNVLTFSVDYDQLLTSAASTTYTFSTGYTTSVESAQQTQGLWVSVDSTLLPSTDQNDVIDVYDDATDSIVETPDNWSTNPSVAHDSSVFAPSKVITDKLEDLDPTPAFAWRLVDAAATTATITARATKFPAINDTPRGSNYPQLGPGGVYDYEGYTLVFSAWFRSLIAQTPTIALDFSFDGGATWTTSTPTALIADTGGYEDSTFLTESVIIPADVELSANNEGILVRVTAADAATSISIEIDAPSLEVKYISSRYLTNATVARSRHSQYFGELIYLWSKTPLTLREQEYLGVLHKSAAPKSSFGGATISSISSDTPAGNGTLSYKYNSTALTKQLKWDAPTVTASPSWTSVGADGTYRLTASGGSYIEVDVITDNLPVLVGTLPSTKTRTIAISDNTIKPGLPRRAFTAHSSLEIIDASEYDSSGDPLNVQGILDENDFNECDFINLEINEGSDTAPDPIKYAYIAPDALSPVGEEIELALVATNYEADLDYYSDEDQVEATLYENGVPVPNDLWIFLDANTVSIPSTSFSPTLLSITSTFTIDYALLHQITTDVIDLGAAFQDYMWLADYWMFDRMDKTEGEYATETPLYFNFDTGRAYLDKRSSMDPTTTTLYVQQANGRSSIPTRYWRFLNDKTISLDASFQALGQYFLVHNELRVYPESRLTVTFEHRSATTMLGVDSETFSVIDRNENVYVHQAALGHQYHQLRLSVSGVRDLSDFRIRSLVLKGLQIHGSSPSVEGITNVWGI